MSKKKPSSDSEHASTVDVTAEFRTEALAEYGALRNEILKRIEMRHQLLGVLMLAFGTLLTLGVTTGIVEVILIYPLLALAFAFAWMHNDVRIKELADYISTHVEDTLGRGTHPCGIWWEHYITGLRGEPFHSHGSQHKHGKAPESGSNQTLTSEQAGLSLWSAFVRWGNRQVLKATEVSTVGIIGFTQFLAVLVALPRMKLASQGFLLSVTRVLLLLFDVAAILLSVFLVRIRRKSYGKTQIARNSRDQG